MHHAVEMRSDGGWQTVLAATGHPYRQGDIEWFDFLEIAAQRPDGAIVLAARTEDLEVTMQARIEGDAAYFRCDLRLRQAADYAKICQLYEVVLGPADEIWTPHLCPDQDSVVGQFAFHCPYVAVRSGRTVVSLVPDLDLVETTWTKMPVALLVRGPRSRPILGYGMVNHRPYGNLFFAHDPELKKVFVFHDVASFGWYVLVDGAVDEGEAWRPGLEWLWQRYGVRFFRDPKPQAAPVQRFFSLARGALEGGLIFRHGRGREARVAILGGRWQPGDACFGADSNALLTALGFAVHSRQEGDEWFQAVARGVRNLLLSAPRFDGAFATVWRAEVRAGRVREIWQASAPPGGEAAFSTAEISTTGLLALKWQELCGEDSGLRELATGAAGWLEGLLRGAGTVPAYVDAETGRPWHLLRTGVHAAAAAALMAAAGAASEDRELVAAAVEANAIAAEAAKGGAAGWLTYCRGGHVLGLSDAHTGAGPEDALALIWLIWAACELARATGEGEFVEQAERWAGRLARYQCIWQPPFVSTSVVGGLAAGNCLGGFSHGLGGFAALAWGELFELTRNPVWLQRAAAAAKACLALVHAPENEPVNPKAFDAGPEGLASACWAPKGEDLPGPPACFDESPAPALAALAILRARWSDLLAVPSAGACVGVNGFATVGACQRQGREILLSPGGAAQGLSEFRLKATGLGGDERFSVRLWGRGLGEYGVRELEDGIVGKV